MLDPELRKLTQRADELIRSYVVRDGHAAVMRAVRRNDFDSIAPDGFNDEHPAPIIANRIDTMARDFVASTTLLPSFNCTPASDLSDQQKRFAATRTKIANSYVESSRLQAQMPHAVDAYNCYGMLAFEVEPDFDNHRPRIRALDGSAVYATWDNNLCTVEAAVVTWQSQFALEAQFPGYLAQMRVEKKNSSFCNRQRIRVIRYQNKQRTVVYLPDDDNEVLLQYSNKIGCTIVAVPRPSGAGDWNQMPKGAYDDLVYPLLAENELRMLALEGTYKAVEAPVAVPMDVTDMPYGPDAIIRTMNPQAVQRVPLNLPSEAFTTAEIIDRDIQQGGMAPGSRSGNIDASVITGRGIEALGEGYSAQIALAQQMLAFGLKMVIEKCFEMDEAYWPDLEKEIRGQESNTAFRINYTPSKNIKGDYSISVEYGFLLGLDANRALVFILQAQAAGLISMSTAATYLPMKLNLAEEVSKIQLEQLRNSLIQSFAALGQFLPQFVANGQDPSVVIAQMSQVIKGVKGGKEIEEVASEVFQPPPPPPAPSQSALSAPGSEPGGGGPTGQAPPGLATEGPNARPDLQMMFSGITAAGKPNLAATVSRMTPVAGQ